MLTQAAERLAPRGIPAVSTRGQLRQHILSSGCCSREENERIYEKWFAHAPRYVFRAVNRKYGITRMVLCDVGCAYGMNLAFCAPGSYGIEIERREVEFARSVGLTVYRRDIVNDEVVDLPKADVVWCASLLEHVESPHICLRKLHLLLRPGGLVVLYVPTIPLLPWLGAVPGLVSYVSGYTASDHITAFVPSTLRFCCERAGFETIEISPFYPGVLRVFNPIPLANRLFSSLVYVGRKIEDWEYHPKSTRRVAANLSGFVFKGQDFSDLRASPRGLPPQP